VEVRLRFPLIKKQSFFWKTDVWIKGVGVSQLAISIIHVGNFLRFCSWPFHIFCIFLWFSLLSPHDQISLNFWQNWMILQLFAFPMINLQSKNLCKSSIKNFPSQKLTQLSHSSRLNGSNTIWSVSQFQSQIPTSSQSYCIYCSPPNQQLWRGWRSRESSTSTFRRSLNSSEKVCAVEFWIRGLWNKRSIQFWIDDVPDGRFVDRSLDKQKLERKRVKESRATVSTYTTSPDLYG
jgi:hypothetical protein